MTNPGSELKDRVLVFEAMYHLGDDPGIFQNAVFIGHRLSLPMNLAYVVKDSTVSLVIRTRHVETWGKRGKWNGHSVLLDTTHIGYLEDRDDKTPEGTEIHTFTISADKLEAIAGTDSNFAFSVVLERQDPQQGRADDFLFLRLETVNAVVRMGWKKSS